MSSIEEGEDHISAFRPLTIRMTPIKTQDGSHIEHPSVSMYCQFSAEEHFKFDKKDIIYCVDLYPKIGEFYTKLAEELYAEEVASIREDKLVETEEEESQDWNQVLDSLKKKHFH